MPIVDMQIRMRELGRIRTGNQVATGNGRKRPAKLETFRLTSASEALTAAAAELWGGEVVPWESPAGKQFEVITTAAVLNIVIPPGQALSQWYELWSGGGCQRRCDGLVETLSDGPCLCPADSSERREAANDGNACKPTTRLNVILPDLPDLGLWRLESHGYYAAVELAGAAQFLSMASAAGMNIPARLRLEQREKKVPGKPTNRYAVPVIEFTTTRIVDLLAAGAGPMMLGDPASQIVPSATPQIVAGSTAPRTRQAKVDRPSMGPAPAVPDGSDFGRRQPVAPAPPPATNGHTPAPETVAGFEVVDEPSAAPAEPPFVWDQDAVEPGTFAPLIATIRQAALEDKHRGPVKGAEAAELRALFTQAGLTGAVVNAALAAIWPGFDVAAMTSNQANAILLAGESDPEFAAHWRDLATQPVSA